MKTRAHREHKACPKHAHGGEFVSDAVCDYIVEAVNLVASDGIKLLPDYRFDPATGLWHHRAGAAEPPLRLTHLEYDADGELRYPQRHRHAGDEALAGYLDRARRILQERPAVDVEKSATGMTSDFESLRWFPLPTACLS